MNMSLILSYHVFSLTSAATECGGRHLLVDRHHSVQLSAILSLVIIRKTYLLLFSTFLYFFLLFSKKVKIKKKRKKSHLLENVFAILKKKVKIMKKYKKYKKIQQSTKKVVKSKGDFLWKVVTTYSKLYFFYLLQVKKVQKVQKVNDTFSWWSRVIMKSTWQKQAPRTNIWHQMTCIATSICSKTWFPKMWVFFSVIMSSHSWVLQQSVEAGAHLWIDTILFWVSAMLSCKRRMALKVEHHFTSLVIPVLGQCSIKITGTIDYAAFTTDEDQHGVSVFSIYLIQLCLDSHRIIHPRLWV